MKTNSKSHTKIYVTVLVVLIALIVGGVSILIINGTSPNSKNNTLNEDIENEELIAQDINALLEESKEIEFTEFFGYDSLDVNKDNPTITLRNSSNNKVLLKYDVYDGDKQVFTSEMLKPGDITKVNVFELLDKGEHNLEYHISSYDQLTQNLLTSDIIQKQKIVIS